MFPAPLRLERHVIDVDGKLIQLAPGMNVTAEVKTGRRRRVVEFLLSPIQRAANQILKER
jgi:hemolysin D